MLFIFFKCTFNIPINNCQSNNNKSLLFWLLSVVSTYFQILHSACTRQHTSHETAYEGEEKKLTKKSNILRKPLPKDGCTSRQSEMNKSVTSGQVTVKRDLVVAPGRRGEAVCPLKALLQSQQPHANSLSRVCSRLCSACQSACSSTHTMLQAEAPWCTLVSPAHQIACLSNNDILARSQICFEARRTLRF